MKSFKLLCLSAIALLASCGGNQKDINKLGLDTSAPLNTLTDKEKAAGWELLFNGKNMDGWHGYNLNSIPSCWTIEDDCITMNATDGSESQDIITDKIYKNFILSLEYKMTPAANSGILFQFKEDPKYKYPYETGPEFQVIDDKGWPDTLEDWQKNGGNYAMYPPVSDANKPIGEWNQIILIVDGNHVTQYLNGEKTAEYEKYSDDWTQKRNSGKWADYPDYGKYDEGNIALQNHGTKVWYRNIKLKELK
ncbi:MAG: DUF1080 domain-containing protein [Bacteroidales bacterium]|nr:DUF1080 domain-containing protein [Bacteroidales bacterium]